MAVLRMQDVHWHCSVHRTGWTGSRLNNHWYLSLKYKLQHLERPQLLIENGEPVMLFLAADTLSKDLGEYAENGHSFNVHIPLK